MFKITFLLFLFFTLFSNSILGASVSNDGSQTSLDASMFSISKKQARQIDKKMLKLYKSNHYEEAFALMQKTKIYNANNFYFHYIYAQCAKQLGKYEEAAQAFERALILKNDAAGVRFELAKMYIKLGNYVEAKILIENIIEFSSNEAVKQDLKNLLLSLDKRSQNNYFDLYLKLAGGTDSNIINQAIDEAFIYPNWQYFNDVITGTGNGTLAAYAKDQKVPRVSSAATSSYLSENAKISYIRKIKNTHMYWRAGFGLNKKDALNANYHYFDINYDASLIYKSKKYIMGADILGVNSQQNKNSISETKVPLLSSFVFRAYGTYVFDSAFQITGYATSSSNTRGEEKAKTTMIELGGVVTNKFYDNALVNSFGISNYVDSLASPQVKQMFLNEPNSLYVYDKYSYSGFGFSEHISLHATSKVRLFANARYGHKKYKYMDWLYSYFNDILGNQDRYKLDRAKFRQDNFVEVNAGFKYNYKNYFDLGGKIAYQKNSSNIPLYRYDKTILEVSLERNFNW